MSHPPAGVCWKENATAEARCPPLTASDSKSQSAADECPDGRHDFRPSRIYFHVPESLLREVLPVLLLAYGFTSVQFDLSIPFHSS